MMPQVLGVESRWVLYTGFDFPIKHSQGMYNPSMVQKKALSKSSCEKLPGEALPKLGTKESSHYMPHQIVPVSRKTPSALPHQTLPAHNELGSGRLVTRQ